MILFGTLVVWEFDVYLAVNLLFGHDEPSAVKLWSCEAVKLWSCEAVKLWSCEAVKLWSCEAVNFARWAVLCQVLYTVSRTVRLKNFFRFLCENDCNCRRCVYLSSLYILARVFININLSFKNIRTSSALLHKKQSSTCKKHACGCFFLAPWIYSAYF